MKDALIIIAFVLGYLCILAVIAEVIHAGFGTLKLWLAEKRVEREGWK